VVTYGSNTNTSTVIREMVSTDPDKPLRILLETDAPYMVPANLYGSIPGKKRSLPLCHTAMVPWTAAFVADVAGEKWDANKVMADARENARKMYGV
jgi:TatD DNase family protein